jgi:hypothetical protein
MRGLVFTAGDLGAQSTDLRAHICENQRHHFTKGLRKEDSDP